MAVGTITSALPCHPSGTVTPPLAAHFQVNPEEERLARWTTCLLTGMPLQPPCVCDELGSLYNKDAVIHALVGKTIPKGLSHISSLKHVFDIHLERSADKAGGKEAVQFSCPISGQPLNGKYKFKVVRSSGHVLSERALKEVRPCGAPETVLSDLTSPAPRLAFGVWPAALRSPVIMSHQGWCAEGFASSGWRAHATGTCPP